MLFFNILALSFLVPDAIVSEPFTVPYIETVERIQADSAHAIAGQSARVNQPRIAGMRNRLVRNIITRTKYTSGITGVRTG